MLSLSPVRRKFLAFAAAAVALGACDVPMPSVGGGGPRIDTAQPVTVALLVPRSGPAAAVGGDLERAARLAVGDVQGAEIDLKVYDTAGTQAGAVTAAEAALGSGAKIILGPLFAENAAAVGRVAAARGVNVLSFSNNPSVAGNNVFVLGTTFQNTADRLVRFAAARGKGSIYIVNGQDTAEAVGRAAIERAIAGSSARLAGVSSFPLSQQGIIDAMPGIARSIRQSGAQSVFLTSGAEGALPFLAELLPENGIGPDIYQTIGLQRLDVPASALSLKGLQGAWFALPDPTRAGSFAARYSAAYGNRPNPIAGLAYDGIAAIGSLVASGDSAALTGRGLTRSGGFSGALGPFRLLGSGTNERGLAVAEIRNNQVVVIDPAPRAFGGAGF